MFLKLADRYVGVDCIVFIVSIYSTDIFLCPVDKAFEAKKKLSQHLVHIIQSTNINGYFVVIGGRIDKQ